MRLVDGDDLARLAAPAQRRDLVASFLRRMLLSRWTIAAASCIVQLALGSVYVSSLFVAPIMEQYGTSKAGAAATFSITITTLGVTAGFGGALQGRYGPRVIATLGGLLYGGGLCLAAFASNLVLLYLAFGLIGGIGLGLAYIVPVAMLIRWFPDKRGMISGLAVAGFGGGAFAISPIAAALLTSIGLRGALIAFGLSYTLLIVSAAQFFRTAPEGYAPDGWTPPVQSQQSFGGREFTLAEALRAPRWYVLWLILALNVTAGAALLSVAAPLAQDFCAVGPTTAALMVMAISLTNGAGRPFWGWASDRIGRPATFLVLFIIQALAFRALGHVADFALLLALAAVIGMCFGAGFAAMPAFAADAFGSKHAGAIYGAMLTAWSAGAVVGPLVTATLDYRLAASLIAWLMLASAILPVFVGWRDFAAAGRKAFAMIIQSDDSETASTTLGTHFVAPPGITAPPMAGSAPSPITSIT